MTSTILIANGRDNHIKATLFKEIEAVQNSIPCLTQRWYNLMVATLAHKNTWKCSVKHLFY